jgi:hypothetical protein
VQQQKNSQTNFTTHNKIATLRHFQSEGHSMGIFELSSLFVNTVSAVTATFVAVLAWKEFRRERRVEGSVRNEVQPARPPLGKNEEDYIDLIEGMIRRYWKGRQRGDMMAILALLLFFCAVMFLLGSYSDKLRSAGNEVPMWLIEPIMIVGGPILAILMMAVLFVLFRNDKAAGANFYREEFGPALRDPRLNPRVASIIVDRFGWRLTDYTKAIAVSIEMFKELDRRERDVSGSIFGPAPAPSVPQ